MTTICTDGVTLATDGLAFDGVIVSRRERKHVVEGGAIYALAGTACMMRPVIEWVKAGADPQHIPKVADNDWGVLLVIDREGMRCYSSKVPYAENIDLPFAMGSGRQMAWGALKAGMSPLEAVGIACDGDPWSGGEIQVINISEALGLEPIREAAE